ncbi:MAG: rhamnose transport system permease protein, partial [Gaiellales bacterium]|nr:rhamnose transport system permease protein [Gaiellales bacterium]
IVLLGGISIFGGRGTILGLVLAVGVIATLQDALTLDLMSPQDQNVVIGALLVASVILPNASSIYSRARTRVASAAARRASRRLPVPGGGAP